MKRIRGIRLALATAAILASVSISTAQEAAPPDGGPSSDQAETAPAFSRDQIEQLVAPIALYPDSLMAQVLMASTYPLEIVEASRWLKKNPGLKGDDLDDALKDKDWDPSVKGLCAVPDVVQRMNDNLEWTQDLGDAFLAQQSDVLDSVQALRAKAYEAGNLKTTPQQKVVVEQKEQSTVYVVQQASPQVIYVPTYSPAVVYGPSWYYPQPYYPAMYAPPGYGLLTFGLGMAVGAAIWGDCHWGYGYHGGYYGGYHGGHGNYYGGHNNINININNYNNFNKRVSHHGGNWNGNGSNWNHNPQHRKGVNYRSTQTAQKFGASAGQNRVTRDQARGYADRSGNRASAGAMDRPGSGSLGGAGNKAGPGSGGGRPDKGSLGGAGNKAGLGSGGGRPDKGSLGGAGNKAMPGGGNKGMPGGGSKGTLGGAGNKAGQGSAGNKGSFGGSGNRGSVGSAGNRAGSAPKMDKSFGGGGSRPSSPSGKGSAFQRSGSGSFDRAASSRGASSRGGSHGGGGSRGGGGGGGRGGRGR